jgi:AcrR family transcriptional regulator
VEPRTPAAARRSTRSDARRNYDRLVAAAGEAFAEHGSQASLDDIARRAGVGPGTLYRHFPAREDLIAAALQDRVEALCEQARGLRDIESPVAALGIWLRALIEHSTTYRGLAASLIARQLATQADATASSHAALRAAGMALVSRAQQAGQIRADIDATAILRLVNAIAWASEQSPDGPDYRERHLQIVLDGLRAGPAGP